MAGYIRDARTRLGLIALLAARRVKAEKLRRAKATDPHMASDVDPAVEAKARSRKAGWFR